MRRSRGGRCPERERVGETRQLSKTTEAELDRRGRSKWRRRNSARSTTAAERDRTTPDDGQMKQAALPPLSSRSVLLSIKEECTPSSIPHFTPSVTV